MQNSHPRILRRLNLVLAATVFVLGFSVLSASAQVLFDNTKAETAGNADWIIDTHQPIPSPSITTITASSSETNWTGALSSWGIALAKLRNSGQISLAGNGLETLPSSGRITYGDNSNPQDLSHYQVYVVCEPNILFTAAEKAAVLNFVQNGGGLFLVADHTGSDRNNDGSDSLVIWNDLFSNNSVQTTPFGFTFNADSGTPTPIVDSSSSDPIIHGIGGTVTTLKYDVGCTMNITDPSICHAAVWESNPTKVMVLYGTFGAGRFVAIGDSSVTEDATSSSGTTYAGWTTPADNGYCAINGTVWLLNTNSVSTNSLPTVTTGSATSIGTNAATLNATVDPNGQDAGVRFLYGLTTNYNFITNLAGVLSGASTQAVSAVLGGLTPGTAYHFAAAATSLSGSVTGLDQSFTTTTTTNSGGGGGTNFTGVLAGWDVSGSTNYGASPLPPSSNAPNISVIGFTRGSGLTTLPTAAARGWGANGWSLTTAAAGIAASQYVTFSLMLTNGSSMSISSISRFDYRHSGTGPTNGLLQYQIGTGAFADVTTMTFSNSASSGASLGAIDLSGVTALQNVPAGTTVTFRLVNYNAIGTGGTWYVYDVASSTALDFAISGSVANSSQGTPPPIQAWRQQYLGTTNNTGNAADTYVASSDGMPNLLKYALGLNPLVAATNPITGDISTGFLRLTVPRNTNARDITYLVESAGDLKAGWNTNVTVVDLNTPALLRAHDTNAVSGTSSRFIRLQVTDP